MCIRDRLPSVHAQGQSDWVCLSFSYLFCHQKNGVTSRTSEHVRSFDDNSISLICTCYWADLLPLTVISAVSNRLVHFVSHFIYSHESGPRVTSTTCSLDHWTHLSFSKSKNSARRVNKKLMPRQLSIIGLHGKRVGYVLSRAPVLIHVCCSFHTFKTCMRGGAWGQD